MSRCAWKRPSSRRGSSWLPGGSGWATAPSCVSTGWPGARSEAAGMTGWTTRSWPGGGWPGRLIFFVRNHGEDLAARGQLADRGLEDLLEGVFGPPEGRPTARELLVNRLGRSSPVPRGASGGGAWLRDGYQRFWDARNRKH